MADVTAANSKPPCMGLQAVAWVSLAVAVLSLLTAWMGSARETVVVPHDKTRAIVALFGDAWHEPSGEFRVTGGRLDGSVVRIFLAAPGRRVSMTLEHARARQPLSPDALVVEQPENDVVAVLACTPACDGPSMAQLRSLAERVLAGNPSQLWVVVRGFAVGRERIVALALALSLCCVTSVLGLVALWRARPLSRQRLAEAALVCGVCATATAVLGHPSVANWYSNNLPALGGVLDGEDQNGMAGFFVQAVVRMIIPWDDHALFGLNLLLHAAAGGVFYIAFRTLLIERREALCALVLWAVLPLSVRIGWSDAQHVQVEVLFALLLLVWLRAQDDRHWPERMLAPLLAALLPAVRLEALVLAPLPLLFGPLVGKRRGVRRLLDALAYGVLLALSAGAVFELFIRRYDMPLPGLGAVFRSMPPLLGHLRLLRQFVFVDSGMPNWVPVPAIVLTAIGAVVLAVRQPRRLAVLLAAFCIPQLLLGRLFNAEGMVGARYFFPLLALLMLVPASGLTTIVATLQRLLARHCGPSAARFAAAGAAALGVFAVIAVSFPLYRYEYTFQGEHRFLRQALAALPADAVVLHLPVREDDEIHNDPDCCLDLPNSPLALAFPAVRFEPIPIRRDRPRLPASVDERTYYYEGALCRLAPTPATEGRNPGLSRMLREQCAALANDPRLEPVASALVPSNGFWPFLEPGEVPLRLYRVRASMNADGLRPLSSNWGVPRPPKAQHHEFN